MYRPDSLSIYTDYGCTVLAWGGASTREKVRELRLLGVHSTGSMWCLTAGAKTLHDDADLREAVCRTLFGEPIAVWWLFDNVHEGTPTWFGCTNHPVFRAHVRKRVAEEMRGGAAGLHVDDHLGTAHTTAFLNGCFCDLCIAGFSDWLVEHGTASDAEAAGVTTWKAFDYRDLLRRHVSSDAEY